MGLVVIVGGSGALGSCMISVFKRLHYVTVNIDHRANAEADENYAPGTVDVERAFQGRPVVLVVNAAGGWQAGSAADANLCAVAEQLYAQNVASACLAARVAAVGRGTRMLVLVGSKAVAVHPCPELLGYGMAKTAVTWLAENLAVDRVKGGLAPDTQVVLLLPEIMDTEANRLAMPTADRSKWTLVQTVADKLAEWLQSGADLNGTQWLIVTRNNETTWTRK